MRNNICNYVIMSKYITRAKRPAILSHLFCQLTSWFLFLLLHLFLWFCFKSLSSHYSKNIIKLKPILHDPFLKRKVVKFSNYFRHCQMITRSVPQPAVLRFLNIILKNLLTTMTLKMKSLCEQCDNCDTVLNSEPVKIIIRQGKYFIIYNFLFLILIDLNIFYIIEFEVLV